MNTSQPNVLLARQFANGEFSDAKALVEHCDDDRFVVKVMLDNKPFYVGRTRGGVRKFSDPKTLIRFCKDDLKLKSVTWLLEEEKQRELKLS